jgi:hypothetical protein
MEALFNCLAAVSRDRPAGHAEISQRITRQADVVLESFADFFCSEAADIVMQRHFIYYFGRVNQLGIRVEMQLEKAVSPKQTGLIASRVAAKAGEDLARLTQFMLDHFPSLAESELQAYPAYNRFRLSDWDTKVESVRLAMSEAFLDPSVAQAVNDLLDHIQASGTLITNTYRQLTYFERFLQAISTLSDLPPEKYRFCLQEQLIRMNFNHLTFLQYLQQDIRREMSGLKQVAQTRLLCDRLTIFDHPSPGLLAYDRQWPGLFEMMSHWLREELSLLRSCTPSAPVKKLTLRTSVAHLACLLRFCHEDELPGIPLSELFRWVSANLATKRQNNISAGSLSKQFYTVNQFTAARVREYLLKIVARINVEYFPALVAISAVVYFH